MNDDDDIINNILDYKGVFYDDNSEKKYFEGGAHFSYSDLYRRLTNLSHKLSPGRVGVFRNKSEGKSDSKDNTCNNVNLKLQNKYIKLTDNLNMNSLRREKLFRAPQVQATNNINNVNYKNSNSNNRNIFNKQAPNKKNTAFNSNSSCSKVIRNNENTIHFINNNNINLTHLNVNLNLNLNEGSHSNSRNILNRNLGNLDVLDKISILKRSVEKYSENAKKKLETELIRNALNNETINSNKNLNNFSLKSNNSNHNSNKNFCKKEIIYKKVNLSSLSRQKTEGKLQKLNTEKAKDSTTIQRTQINLNTKHEHGQNNQNNQNSQNSQNSQNIQNNYITNDYLTKSKLTHNRNISQPISDKDNNASINKIDNLLGKINNIFLSSYSNKMNTRSITKRRMNDSTNHNENSAVKFNSLLLTKHDISLDKTNLFYGQLSNRQSGPSIDKKRKEKTVKKADNNKVIIFNDNNTNTNTNTNILVNNLKSKSRNDRYSLLKNSVMFNTNKTPKSCQHQFLLSNFLPGGKINIKNAIKKSNMHTLNNSSKEKKIIMPMSTSKLMIVKSPSSKDNNSIKNY